MLLSIVVPLYNESHGIEHFHNDLLLPELKKATQNSYEVVYVNDGSTDDTLRIIQHIAEINKKVKVVNLSRNFGKEIATTVGIKMSIGQATIIIDGDGQHPASLIPVFIKKWRDGAQIVVGIRKTNQKEGYIKKYGSKLFYRLLNSISGLQMVPRSTDYRLIDSGVREEFNRFTERNRITRGLIDWLGFERDYIEFDAPARIAGEASYSNRELAALALNSFISLSLKPLLLIAWLGAAVTTLSFIAGLFVIIEQIVLADPLSLSITGTAMLGILIMFLVGLILISQGVVALYLSHVHSQTQGHPLYVIDTRHSVNIDKGLNEVFS